jgi:predicted ABC-type ATPase
MAITNKADFVYEGHFPNEATWEIPRKFKAEEYCIHMIFFGLTNEELSALRVLGRAQEGGHNVDSLSLRDNFYGNLEKVNKYFVLINSLHIVDTSEADHISIAIFEDGKIKESIAYTELPEWFVNYMPSLAEKIKKDTKI